MSKSALKKQASNGIIVIEKMRDYSNDPFVIKKREMALEFIKKYGLPESNKKKKK